MSQKFKKGDKVLWEYDEIKPDLVQKIVATVLGYAEDGQVTILVDGYEASDTVTENKLVPLHGPAVAPIQDDPTHLRDQIFGGVTKELTAAEIARMHNYWQNEMRGYEGDIFLVKTGPPSRIWRPRDFGLYDDKAHYPFGNYKPIGADFAKSGTKDYTASTIRRVPDWLEGPASILRAIPWLLSGQPDGGDGPRLRKLLFLVASWCLIACLFGCAVGLWLSSLAH